jgi:tetratricopeptide (TPR) repeat protein
MTSKRDALVASAEKSLAKGKVDAALKDYQKVLEDIPGDIGILNKVGDLLMRLNRNEEAIPYFTKIAEHFAKDGFFLRGIAIYKKINRLDPSRLDVYERLAELYAKQGLMTEAKSQYQVLADYHAKNDNAVGALGIYQKMAQTDPQNVQLHVKLADLYTLARRKPEALKEYAVVAAILRERGALDESIRVYEKALQMAPDNTEILRAFVPVLLGSRRTREARAVVRRALEATPRSVPLFLLSAETALAEVDVDDAQEWLSKAQSIEPSSAEVLALALKIQQAGGTPSLSFEAAAVLADQAMRRGEAKKALAILAPVAEANPGREDVLQRVIQVAEAAGDTQTVIHWRSVLVDVHKAVGRIGDAATGLRTLMQLVPDSAEYRTRLAQLEPPAARVDPDGSASRGRSTMPAVPVLEISGKRPRPSVEASGKRRTPAEPSPPIPPPPAFAPPAPAPAAPAPAAAEGEFILEFEDDVLVHDPGSTGPVPNAVRRLSETEMPSFSRPTVAPPAPPRAPLPPLDALRPPSVEVLQPARLEPLKPAPLLEIPEPAHPESLKPAPLLEIPKPPPLEAEPAPVVKPPSISPSLDDIDISWSEAPRPVPREFHLEVDIAPPPEHVQAPAEPAAPPPGAELIEVAGEPLPAVEPPPAAPEPGAPAVEAMDPGAIESALAEADVFRKYGLYDKAVEHLRGILKRAPDTLPLREKLFELALEGGRKKVALAEAERLKNLYRAEGRDDRVSAIDALLVERTSAETVEVTESEPGLPALLKEMLPRPRPAAVDHPVVESTIDVSEVLASLDEPAFLRMEPPADELLEIDFCLEQGMVVDASERLQTLERRFAGHPQLVQRRARLDGGVSEDARPALRDILSEDFESVLDAELGRALSDEMARGAESAPPTAAVKGPPAPALDESALFSDEQEFFNFAGELQTELKQEVSAPDAPDVSGGDIPLEEIFREFKKGVEQQLSPEDYETHYNLGIAYKEMSLTDEAISEFQRAAKSPQYAVECCSMLGLCFLEKGLPQLAIKWYRKGLETSNLREEDRLGLQYDLANIYVALGDRENAYRTFLEIYGSNASFRDVGERLKELAPA